MKKEYDFVYLTNTPSLYKLNLCNAIAKTHRVLLILYGYGSEAVNKRLEDSNDFDFDYYFLKKGDSNKRNFLYVFMRLLKLMRCIRCRKVLYAGWLAPEYNLYAFLSPKYRNVMVCESSILDVSMTGLSGWVKRKIINRMSAVLPSGKPHAQLFDKIGFKGEKHITGSVGIFYKPERRQKEIHTPLRYLYVGRLVAVKNVELLIDEFNHNGKPLTIVGSGILETELRNRAKPNISFTGFIENEKLGEVYQAHDIFILPSYYEPWGLVVEETLYWGLLVIVSNRVGSSVDMVQELKTGCIFESRNRNSLHTTIETMEQHFDEYQRNVWKIDWKERDKQQIQAYISLIENEGSSNYC